METASFLGWTMRARLLLVAVAVAAGLLVAALAPAAASARDGLIIVREKITLKFPVPGVYKGKVYHWTPKIKREPAKGRKIPSAGQVDRAQAAALDVCFKSVSKRPVRVLHLSKPPFLIGMDKPGSPFPGYRVDGPEPPTGDPVKAFQLAVSKRVRTGKSPRFRWQVKCKGAQIVKPYPH